MRTGRSKLNYAKEIALISSGRQWLALGILLCLLVLLPQLLRWTDNMTWVTFLNFTLVLIIAVLGLNVITGMAGQISLGHSAFILTGGYTFAVLTTRAGWSFWAAIVPAVLLTGIIGVIVALPAIRLKGFYVAVVTLAFFFIAQYVVKSMEITGTVHGLAEITYPRIGGFAFSSDIKWYYLLLAFTAASLTACANLRRSRHGRAFIAIRDNEVTAAIMGINVPLTKLRAVFIGSLLAGLSGVLLASYVSVIRLDQFTIFDSIWYLGMIIIGGVGSPVGTVLGVFFLQLVRQLLHVIGSSGALAVGVSLTAPLTYAAYGLLIIVFMIFQPNGIIAVWHKFRVNYKRWPFGE